jgi:hypothetical protein
MRVVFFLINYFDFISIHNHKVCKFTKFKEVFSLFFFLNNFIVLSFNIELFDNINGFKYDSFYLFFIVISFFLYFFCLYYLNILKVNMS